MAKDPSTTRIPRLDGMSRIPTPGSFGTSHIRPPSATAGNVLKSTTQIFRTPALPTSTGSHTTNTTTTNNNSNMNNNNNTKTRPISSYHPAVTPLHDLEVNLKKSVSGDRLNNAVNMISKRTSNVFKKYFGQSKLMSGANSASPGGSSRHMTSSLPQTPLPASKQQQQAKQATLLTSSTPMPLPMPLMRSETFVCDEEKGQAQEQQEQEREEELEQQRPTLESTRLSNVAFCGDVTLLKRTVNLSSEVDNINRTRPVIFTQQLGEEQVQQAQEEEEEEEVQQQQKKQRLELEQVQDATRILSPVHDDRTRVVATSPSTPSSATFAVNRTPPVMPTAQMLDLTKSMDQLPLLEHMSMPCDLDVLGTSREEETEKDEQEQQEHSPQADDDELNVTVLDALDVTLTAALAPDKTNMKLPLNSTVNMERLVDLSGIQSPARHIQLLNLTREFLEQTQTPQRLSAGIGRRSMAQQQSLICLTPPSGAAPSRFHHHQTPVQVHLLSPLLKAARSDLVLPTRTPDGDGGVGVDATLIAAAAAAGGAGVVGANQMLPLGARARYSFGLDLTESTLDSSIDLVDNSFSTPPQLLKKQHSFDLDESLGILTPDQMKEFLDSSSQHNNGNLSHHLELQLAAVHHHQQQHQQQQQHHVQQHQQLLHLQQQQQLQLRMEQTPSPEELPLDPIEPQLVAAIVAQPAVVAAVATAAAAAAAAAVPTTTATVASKQLSNSFITSVTSVTSLDTGYQGDGEMSRPASRGACDHSPSNGPHLGRVSRQPSFPPMPQAAAAAAAAAVAPMRRQDPMTDSDFFTESDADDVLQRGDRRAQVIDGQLYGQAMQPSASVPQLEDSCMESSGIFTDVENRCDEEMRLPELEVDMEVDHDMQEEEVEVDMSPDDSTTQTMRKAQGQQQQQREQQQQHREQPSLLREREREREQQPRPLSSSSAATTTLSLSNRTSYCSVDGGSAKSFCDEAFSVGSGSVSVGSDSQQQQRSSQLSVQRAASPRPHVSSLTSLCTVENLSTSNSTPAASPKSSKIATNKALKTTTTTPRTTTTTRTSPLSRKSHTPNKWDAVMHKIASNKSTIKTNYSDVKSKVSTLRPQVATAATTGGVGGGGGGSTPPTANVLGRSQSSSPSSSSGSPRISPPIRRSPSATAPLKQQRSTLKPLSVTSTSTSTRQPQDKGSVGVVVGGSVFARLAAKSPTSPTAASAAKQRLQSTQVNRGRSYSKDSQKSSHSDLSSLCNGNASGGGSPKLLAKTPLRAAKKRDVRNLSISPTDLGPPPKTQQTAKGQSTRNKSNSPTSTATQKRLASSNSITIAAISPANSNKVCAKTTAIQQQNLQVLQNKTDGKNNSTTIKNGTTKHLSVNIAEESLRSGVDQTELQELNELGLLLTAVPNAVPRDSKRASISHEHIDCTCGTTETADCQCDAAAEKAPKVKRQERKEPLEPLELDTQESNKERLEQELIHQNELEKVQPKEAEIAASKVLYENTTKTLVTDGGIAAAQLPALKCYIQNGSLNYELLASCLELRKQQQDESQCQLMGLAIVVQFMSKQMDKLSCQESKVSSKLEETLTLLQQTQRNCEELRKQLHDKDVEWTRREQENKHLQRSELQQAQDKLQEVQMLAKERFRELESQLQAKDEEKKHALQSYHQEIEHQLRHKQEQLQLAEQQVLQLQKRIRDQEQQEQQLREKLTRKESSYTLRLSSAAQREEEAQATIKALTKELQTLRASTEHKERDLRDRLALSQDEVTVLRTSSQRRSPSTSLNDSAAELCRLTSEADSLRCVLELKQAEISTISKQNAEQQREIDELRSRSNRVPLLEATNEMLRTELETKTEKEKDLQRQNDEMQKAFNHESIKRKRISCDNEQLQYNLKQRTEQLLLVQNQLQEQLSNCSQLDASLNYSRSNNSSMRASLDCAAARCNASSSSTTSSPPASPVIKGVIERNDSVSWVLEMDDETPQVAASKLVRRAGSLRSTCERSPTQRRQLSQSASVASGGSSTTHNGHANGHGHHSHGGPNPLSQSMSATILMRTQSHEPESPRPLCRARSQSICGNQKTTTAPATVEPSMPDWHAEELRASSPQPLPPPPVDMRARCSTMNKAMNKKFQEIQESAGEAMVSGANSEDESCSASSEDMRSSSASSTASAAGLSLSKRQKQPSRMSIEEALLLEQVNGSLNGTPMEVSWSEDAADADAAEAHVLA